MVPRLPGYRDDAYLPFHSPRGRSIERRPLATNSDELIHLVADGDTVQVFPVHVTDY